MSERDQVIPVEQLTDIELTEGSPIVGIKSAEQLNLVLKQLAGSALEKWYPEEPFDPEKEYPYKPYNPYYYIASDLKKSHRGYAGGIPQTVAELLEADARKQKHYGALGEYHIIPLPPEPTLMYTADKTGEKRINEQGVPKATAYPDSSLTFLVTQDLFATGKGKIGEVARKCNLYVHSWEYFYNTDHPFRVVFISEPFDVKKTQAALTERREQSAETWHEVMATGLRRAYRAGLPGLGKRR